MCAINVSPEAGDASINIMSTRRKCSTVSGMENSKNTFLLERDKNPVLQCISTVSPNSIDARKNNVSDEYSEIPDYLLQRTSNIKYEIDYCGFPCYSFQDAVLVKDVGISCNLLNENLTDSNVPISEIESYLIRQLKFEYNELSSITKKINAYTKDILSNLAIRCKRKDQVLKKLCVASKHTLPQHADETKNRCSKCYDETKKKYRSMKIDLTHNHSEKKIDGVQMYDAYLLIRGRNREKYRMELDKAFLQEIIELSPKCSNILLHNYLIMKKKKVSSGNISKMPLHKVRNSISPNTYKDHNVNKSFYTTKCNPSLLTNWQEISRQKDCKNAFIASISDKS